MIFKKRRKLKSQAPDCHICKKRSFWSNESADFFVTHTWQNDFTNVNGVDCII